VRYLSLKLIATAAMAMSCAAAAETPFAGLEQDMSAEEFRQAGLDKLSAEELERLNRWILTYSSDTAEQARQAAIIAQEDEPALIESRIEGEFSGWAGSTRFTLQNGQVWQQRVDGSYSVHLTNPEVRIKRNFLGFYNMEIIETGKQVGVKRID